MAGYKLTIDNGGKPIEISTAERDGSDITRVIFKMNTLNDNVLVHADNIRPELRIFGNITKNNRKNILELAKWATDFDQKTLFRQVTLDVYDSDNCTGERLRHYEFNNMFVIDYTESFGETKDGDPNIGQYELFIAQKEGREDKKITA